GADPAVPERGQRPRAAAGHAGREYALPDQLRANLGTWLVFNPATGRGWDGAFAGNLKLKFADFTDGTSTTVGMSEVKAYQAFLRGSGSPAAVPTPPPVTPADVLAYGGTLRETG